MVVKGGPAGNTVRYNLFTISVAIKDAVKVVNGKMTLEMTDEISWYIATL